MPSLAELAERHDTKQAFASIYEHHFGHLSTEPVVLLEIGVHHGASLRMWEDFFPLGRFFGIDIKKDALSQASSRTTVFLGKQQDPELLSKVACTAGPLDIVVDDGSHRAPHQKATLLHLWPRVKPGGWYVVEDTLTSYLERWGMRYREPGTTMEYLKGIADDLHVKWHKREPTLPDVASLHFYPDTCVIEKSTMARQPVEADA